MATMHKGGLCVKQSHLLLLLLMQAGRAQPALKQAYGEICEALFGAEPRWEDERGRRHCSHMDTAPAACSRTPKMAPRTSPCVIFVGTSFREWTAISAIFPSNASSNSWAANDETTDAGRTGARRGDLWEGDRRRAHCACVFTSPSLGFLCIFRVAGTWGPQGLAYNNGGLHSTS